MKKDQMIAQAETNLQRKLDWVGRHDNRVVVITGIVIAMLGVLASACATIICWTFIKYLIFFLGGLLLFISLTLLYYSQFPKIDSPNSSLIFFKTIAKLDFQNFKNQSNSRSKQEYLEDLLFQIHRNSQILDKKFSNLRLAMIFLGLSLLPWLIAIYTSQLYFK
ncbi:MAG: Pycsar system effector family protein [Flavobacterium sp.]